jgi:hypothetical protein
MDNEIFRLAVIGSRSFNDYKVAKAVLDDCHKNVGITSIVSGGAKGADSLGARWAHENEIELILYLPDWERFGKSAGFRRNSEIINDSDAVIAFWDGESKGTADSINKANEKGLDVFIYNYVTKQLSLFEGHLND